MHFVSKYGGCYDTRSNPWFGKNGIISKVKRDLNMCPSTDIVYILNDVVQCRLSGTKYEGKRNEGTGAIADLKTDSIEAQIVADELEGGGSIFIAWNAVNVYRESVQKERVTKSKVYTLIQNLKPKLAKVEAHRQGSNDVDSRICRARKAWCTQLAVRLGYVDYKNDVMAKEGIEGPIPRWYDRENLTPLKIEQIAFWDETHKKSQETLQPLIRSIYSRLKGMKMERLMKMVLIKMCRLRNWSVSMLKRYVYALVFPRTKSLGQF